MYKYIRKKRIKVKYEVKSGTPYHIDRMTYRIPDDSIRSIVMADSANSLIRPGKLFDRNVLEQERQRITDRLRNEGYFAFNKEYISYVADTTIGHKGVDLELFLSDIPVADSLQTELVSFRKHDTYTVRDVYFITDYNPMGGTPEEKYAIKDTIIYKGYYILYGEKEYLHPGTLVENCYILPGASYSTRMVDHTYSAFSRLEVLKYVNIQFTPVHGSETPQLDCHILLTEGKTQLVTTEVEGTNSAGNFGFSLGLTYKHRNIFHGSQTFSARFRAAYENITGDLGVFGSRILKDLVWEKGYDIEKQHVDCGELIYNIKEDEYQGGSGAGCSAVVFNSYIYKKLCEKKFSRVLFMATGALLSSITTQQGESIPCVAHAVVVEG